MSDTKYTYAVARIRALENALFTDAVIEQILACPTAEQALQFVKEKGWGSGAADEDMDSLLNREEEKAWEVIRDVAPDIHLFDVLDAKGDEQESNQITRGDHLLTFDTDFGRVGVMVCYDVRFPEMARTYALAEVEYLMVPAAFFAPRFDHWQQLIGAAALENGMYVMGVNIFGKVCDTLNMCGRSLIVDPWGIQMATAPDKPAFIQAYVDSDYPKQIRDALGTFHNRVPSVYDIK